MRNNRTKSTAPPPVGNATGDRKSPRQMKIITARAHIAAVRNILGDSVTHPVINEEIRMVLAGGCDIAVRSLDGLSISLSALEKKMEATNNGK